ncbi:MAG TPA: preprotein translocase subunit SecY [Nocardioidaceae bacterium]|nr:preprotein translocase subunit SecY [Nocardioidaceae bacterium]
MLGAYANAFRTPDLRRKLLFVLLVIVVFRLGSQIPTPGVNVTNVQACFQATKNQGLYGLINLFSGGALLQLTVFALGIMPYITASIILQLLVVVIPRLENLKNEGQAGQTKITQYTRYLTLALAILQATGITALARSGNLLQGCNKPLLYNESSLWTMMLMVVTMTAGTVIIMWLGELITDRGIGNGMSILIFVQVVATFPGSLWAVKVSQNSWWVFGLVIVIGLILVAAVVFIEQAQRRIPVQYARRMVGRKMFGGSSTYIPLKVNQAGVIPVIFASSLLYLPAMATRFSGGNSAFARFISTYFVTGSHPVYMLAYFLLIIFFTYFYVAITFNPEEVADNMKKYGGFIPGIRAGRPTQEYLNYVLSRITFPGSLYLGIISLIPLIAFKLVGANQNFPFGGTSILIMVGVALDTVKQIESQLQQRNYEGFLR